ncbi:MAG: Rieske 2Fe-2S domain-containing protein [Halomonas sp.]|nr:Rieske 2Fe-2S domain-containing protein [Halomonas sp.]
MSDAWEHYKSAPPRGTRIVRLADVPEGSVASLNVESDNGVFPVLVVNANGTLAAFVNACPHQYLPLDQRSDRILSSDGTLLRCSNHDAAFETTSGQGVEGLGLGECLDAIPVSPDSEGWVIIADH